MLFSCLQIHVCKTSAKQNDLDQSSGSASSMGHESHHSKKFQCLADVQTACFPKAHVTQLAEPIEQLFCTISEKNLPKRGFGFTTKRQMS